MNSAFADWQFIQSYAELPNGNIACAGYQYFDDIKREVIFIQHLNSQGIPLAYQPKKQVGSSVTIYPNPSSGVIKFTDNDYNIQSATITNMQGYTFQKAVTNNELDLSQQPAGIYWVTLSNAQGEIQLKQKVVIVH